LLVIVRRRVLEIVIDDEALAPGAAAHDDGRRAVRSRPAGTW
jgi:hypothetical protein